MENYTQNLTPNARAIDPAGQCCVLSKQTRTRRQKRPVPARDPAAASSSSSTET